MNGMLLTAGEPIASIPASRTVDYNALMLEYYETGRETGFENSLLIAERRFAAWFDSAIHSDSESAIEK